MAEVNEVKKSGKGWIIGIVIALIAVAAFMAITIMNRAKANDAAETAYNYDLSEYVEVGEYKDLPYYTAEVEVTEEEIQQEIDTMLQYASTTETITEGVVEDGDTINIAFVGKIDGEEFEGGTSESFDLTVGTTSMIDGFVEGLMGKKVGEAVTLDLKFPEDYGKEELNGKPVVFDITINNKKVTTVPELNDDFVKENTEFQTVDELRADIQDYIKTSKENEIEAEIQGAMWQKITDGSNVIKEPETEKAALVEEADNIETTYREQAESYSMEWPDFLSMFMGTDEAGFEEMKADYVTSALKDQMVTYAIARTENIEFTDKDYKAELARLLEKSDYTEETFETNYGMSIEEYAEQNGWRFSMLRDKVMEKIKSYGKEVTEEEFDEFYGVNEDATVTTDGSDAMDVEAGDDLEVELVETEEGEADANAEAEADADAKAGESTEENAEADANAEADSEEESKEGGN